MADVFDLELHDGDSCIESDDDVIEVDPVSVELIFLIFFLLLNFVIGHEAIMNESLWGRHRQLISLPSTLHSYTSHMIC